MVTYQHQPLTGPRSIRVLKLLPQQIGGQVRVELAEVSLDDNNVTYEALSYVWGEDSANPREQVLCEGKTLPVTENCWAALLQLRSTDVRTLWIDAICIDQTSLSERNNQVRLMGEIYSRARRVVVWLGEGSLESDTALAWLSEMARGGRATQEPIQAWIQAVTIQLAVMGVGNLMRLLRIVTDVLRRSWFDRMWTLQKLALAREAWMQCGKSGLSWDNLCLGALILAEAIPDAKSLAFLGGTLRGLLAAHHLLRDAVETKRRGQPTGGEIIFDSLLALTSRHASEPRDKVYSLYGLGRLFGISVPEPDYSKPVELVYTEFTRAAILHGKSLTVLYGVCSITRDERLPSWVPNYNGELRTVPASPCHFMPTASSAPSFSFSQDGWQLTVSGVLVDEIDEKSSWREGSDRERPQVLETIHTIQQWQATAARRFPEPYKTGQTVDEAFFRTVVHDGSVVGDRREVERFREPFAEWYRAVINVDVGDMQEKYHGKGNVEIFDALGLENVGAPFHHWIGTLTSDRAFCSTAMGFMGMAPESAKVGDLVILLMGVRLPFVVRQEGDAYRMIGPAYVHGIMDGEFFTGEHLAVSDFTFI